jgi:hypothetical protein
VLHSEFQLSLDYKVRLCSKGDKRSFNYGVHYNTYDFHGLWLLSIKELKRKPDEVVYV